MSGSYASSQVSGVCFRTNLELNDESVADTRKRLSDGNGALDLEEFSGATEQLSASLSASIQSSSPPPCLRFVCCVLFVRCILYNTQGADSRQQAADSSSSIISNSIVGSPYRIRCGRVLNNWVTK